MFIFRSYLNLKYVSVPLVDETLLEEVLQKMHAPAKTDMPVANPHDLANADGLMFGFPTRCGSVFQIKK
jgi:multimeric flavodoxin WrbA